jgi:HlyD family secretion protein
VGAALVLVIIVAITVYQSRKNLVTVQTGKVQSRTWPRWSAPPGEIKPKTYVNIGANAFGKIIKLHVKEGDRVKKGQLLAQLENVQSSADVNATRASVQALGNRCRRRRCRSEHLACRPEPRQVRRRARQARLGTRPGPLQRGPDRQAGLRHSRKPPGNPPMPDLAQAEAKVAQAKAQKDSMRTSTSRRTRRISRASPTCCKRPLTKRRLTASSPTCPCAKAKPWSSESRIPGSTLMTLADMSVITAEVKVDETDIVNVHLGQSADVTIDAIPHKIFHGMVSEIGDNAIVRSTGVATSQATSTSEEAKDFKVVVTLTDPPPDLRPGLSSTAKITTATRSNVSAFRFRRSRSHAGRSVPKDAKGNGHVQAAASAPGRRQAKGRKVRACS